ncbi:MAG: hypothetical protein JNL67_04310 [Planctomycetaceae bacterium]|nr:hypothetical protein [Planctomycetaceae bacterium]
MISVGLVLSLVFGCGLGVVEDLSMEPRPIMVIVPDAELAEAVREQLPRVRIVVLRVDAQENAAVVAARAWEYRNADCMFYDPYADSFDMMIIRERLKNQGVVPIDLRQQALAAEQQRGQLTQPESLLTRKAAESHRRLP